MKPLILSCVGKIGAGKTTVANYLCSKYGFTRISFADPLKQIAARVTPGGKIDKMRDRALLQFLGTEYFRSIDPDYWVNQWVRQYNQLLASACFTGQPLNIVVDDCRFPNEQQMLAEHEAIEIRITRPDHLRLAQATDGLKQHSSEAGLPQHPLMAYYGLAQTDNMTLDQLYGEVDYLLAGLKRWE